MPKYVIEREIPSAGKLSPAELKGNFTEILQRAPQSWPRKFNGLRVTLPIRRFTCVYIAPNKEMVERHAKQSGFPADRISKVKWMIDPTSAEAN